MRLPASCLAFAIASCCSPVVHQPSFGPEEVRLASTVLFGTVEADVDGVWVLVRVRNEGSRQFAGELDQCPVDVQLWWAAGDDWAPVNVPILHCRPMNTSFVVAAGETHVAVRFWVAPRSVLPDSGIFRGVIGVRLLGRPSDLYFTTPIAQAN